MLDQAVQRWTTSDAAELYEVARWGKGYFSVSANGHVLVHPTKEPERFIDLKQLIDRLQLRGIDLPILIRFAGMLKHRLGEIHAAFQAAITEHKFNGNYCCVYPIKVNQQRQVIEEILRFGRPFNFGLEAGSKPELLAVVAMASNETPIICNGFKDAEFIEMAMMAQKIGRQVIPVVEKYTELGLILKFAEKIGVRPMIGFRVKLASRGSGRWQSSGGFRSKFGLTVTEILRALAELKARGMEDCFQLLHFHLGSQITNIRQIKAALNEAVRVYVELVKHGAGLKYLDVGGGLGVDYDGSQTNFESSVNYTLQEYANDVVYHVQMVCDEAGVAHPTIISESGRAVVAYHSALIFGVLGVAGLGDNDVPLQVSDDMEQPILDLLDTFQNLTVRNVLEGYHDAQQALDMAMNLFSAGYLPLVQRSMAENIYWAICHKIQRLVRQLEFVPEELEGLDAMLSDTYFCNFSLFQSMPDSWAIKQLFPVMPIHRLAEKPTRPAVLGDITCDSDGKIEQFIDRRDVKKTLPLHPFNGEPYYLGAFLLGGVPGNPGGHAQPVRRHQRGSREHGRQRRSGAGDRDQGGHGPRGFGLRRVQPRIVGPAVAQLGRGRGARIPPRLRRSRPLPPLLRRRAERLYVFGRAAREVGGRDRRRAGDMQNHSPPMKNLRSLVRLLFLFFVVTAALSPVNPGLKADWPPTLDEENSTTQSHDGRTIERYTHGPRQAWGYPVEASGEWGYPPAQETGPAQQNHNSFYVAAPKNPRENAPLCVVLHSANRTAFDYLGFACLVRKTENGDSPAAAMTNSPDDFYGLYLNSTNSEWWGWSQCRKNVARHISGPAPAELRVLDTIEWVVTHHNIDRNRIYLCGVSMGGCGTLGIGMPHGDIFAAVRDRTGRNRICLLPHGRICSASGGGRTAD